MADIDKPKDYEGNEAVPTAGYDGAAIGPGGKIGPYKLLRILGEGRGAGRSLAAQSCDVLF